MQRFKRKKKRYIIYTRQQIFIILSSATVRWTIYLHCEAFRQNNESLMQKKTSVRKCIV